MNRAQLIANASAVLLRRRNVLRRALDDELSLVGRDDDDESQEDEAYFRLAESESRELRSIDNALERIREGSYGVCGDCGSNIPQARLQALPEATLCIRCQQQSEGRAAHSFRDSRAGRTVVFS